MNNQKIYLVYENFDNCQDYEDHIDSHDVVAACTTEERAKEIVKECYDRLLTKKYEPWLEWIFGTQTLVEHEVVAIEEYDDIIGRPCIRVCCKDGTFHNANNNGIYDYEIAEIKMNELL